MKKGERGRGVLREKATCEKYIRTGVSKEKRRSGDRLVGGGNGERGNSEHFLVTKIDERL